MSTLAEEIKALMVAKGLTRYEALEAVQEQREQYAEREKEQEQVREQDREQLREQDREQVLEQEIAVKRVISAVRDLPVESTLQSVRNWQQSSSLFQMPVLGEEILAKQVIPVIKDLAADNSCKN